VANGLARFKEAASSNRERTCDREECGNSFHSAILATEAQMTTKFKTLSLLMTKISTGTLIALSILILSE
jgi:hypothetical protein